MNHVQLPNSAVVPGKFGRSHPMFYRLGGAGGAPIRPSRLKGAAVMLTQGQQQSECEHGHTRNAHNSADIPPPEPPSWR